MTLDEAIVRHKEAEKLDEAIARYKEAADYDCYNEKQFERAEEYKQLVEWLLELKAYKNRYHKYYKARRTNK